jgi:hypothetical protein
MQTEFKREERYIVFKLSKLHTDELVRAKQLKTLKNAFVEDARVDCVVIESDWPEYEPVWAMIEARVTGQTPALGGVPEVIAYVCHGAPGNAGVMFSYLPIPEGFSRKIDLIDRTHFETLRAENERLRGIQPDFPPRPPDGSGLPRYGLRWNGSQKPVATPMDDGYWTPWHLAERLKARCEQLEAGIKWESERNALLLAQIQDYEQAPDQSGGPHG